MQEELQKRFVSFIKKRKKRKYVLSRLSFSFFEIIIFNSKKYIYIWKKKEKRRNDAAKMA